MNCISLISDFECLLFSIIYNCSSSVKYLFLCIVQVLSGANFFLIPLKKYFCGFFLRILDTSPLLALGVANIYPLFVVCFVP